MDPQQLFCHNPDCPASGKVDRGNIGVHSRKAERYKLSIFTQQRLRSNSHPGHHAIGLFFRRLLLRLA